jgi:hypothetical protein
MLSQRSSRSCNFSEVSSSKIGANSTGINLSGVEIMLLFYVIPIHDDSQQKKETREASLFFLLNLL